MSNISKELLSSKILAQESEKGKVCVVRPFQLVSLLDMYRVRVDLIVDIAQRLEADIKIASTTKFVPEESRHLLQKGFERILEMLGNLELPVSKAHAQKIVAFLSAPNATYAQYRAMLPELQSRMNDELKSVWFFHVPTHQAKFFKSSPFGDEVANKFARAVFDIEEASKCLGTDRSTAAVFHLMRVMEIGVQQFGKKLRVKLPEERVWQDILNRINAKISRMRPRAKQTIVYADLAAHLYNVKVAWRNPVMHPKETYTPEEAEDVFKHVETFMRHLAKEL